MPRVIEIHFYVYSKLLTIATIEWDDDCMTIASPRTSQCGEAPTSFN